MAESESGTEYDLLGFSRSRAVLFLMIGDSNLNLAIDTSSKDVKAQALVDAEKAYTEALGFSLVACQLSGDSVEDVRVNAGII